MVYKAPDYFLAGLIAPLVENDNSIIDECDDEMKNCLNSRYAYVVQKEGVSTIAQIKELIDGFEKGGTHLDAMSLYSAWYDAKKKAHKILVVYSRTFVK